LNNKKTVTLPLLLGTNMKKYHKPKLHVITVLNGVAPSVVDINDTNQVDNSIMSVI